MKKTYEKPFFARHQTGVVNKFGGASLTQPTDQIDGVKIATLVAEYGSPLFVYSEAMIKQKHAELMDAFSLRYPKVQHAWSYKTNYLKAICSCFHQLGSWAEVVSSMEYEMAKRLGTNPAHIIFNGPSKPYHALKSALSDGAMVNIDNMEEIYEIEKIASECNITVACGIRLNMSLGTYVSWDRFGLSLDSGHAYQAVKRAVAGRKIKITGLHTHIGTFIMDPELYRIAVRKVIEFAHLIKKDFGIQIQTINMGGGFASKIKLKGSYLSADSVPRFDRYAEAICEELLSAFPSEALPLLILESGRAMIDEAGSLIATVSATKRLGDGTRSLVMDAGVNLLFTSFWYDFEMVPVIDRGSALEDHIIYGPLCMQIDVIMPTLKIPYLEKGDQVVIRPVGAYNNTQWMQFIQYRPNVVMIGKNGKISLIRKAEDLDYLQSLEQIPEGG
jgi:diaminopimelate decarboxylase